MNFDLSQLDKKLGKSKAAPAKSSKFAPRLLAKVRKGVRCQQCSGSPKQPCRVAPPLGRRGRAGQCPPVAPPHLLPLPPASGQPMSGGRPKH